MTEQLYRIKPLEWNECDDSLKASTVFAVAYASADDWAVYYHASELWPDKGLSSSLEAAKAAAETHYRERLTQGLEAVEVETVSDFQAAAIEKGFRYD